MDTHKCAFSHTLVAGSFGCSRASTVTKRDGPHTVCADGTAALRCAELFEAFKEAALPVFEVPDDLEQMPHSVPVKIQFGGLLGLQGALNPGDGGAIADIHALVGGALRYYGDIDSIPCADFTQIMTSYQVKRRGGR